MFIRKYLSFIFIASLLMSCGSSEDLPLINNDDVIYNAKVIKYNNLSEMQKELVGERCYCYPRNWNQGESFDCEKSYFVHLKISNKNLAAISESETFTKKMLMNRSHSLYGKYHNRWKLYDGMGSKICETEKFEGFRILTLDRKGDTDEILLGPIPKRPFKIEIEVFDSKNYKGVTPPITY